MIRAAIAAPTRNILAIARSSLARALAGVALLAGLAVAGAGGASAQSYDPYDDPAPKYGKGPYGGYGYGYRPAPDCDPDAAYDPRCQRGPGYQPYRPKYRGDGLEDRRYELGRLLGMIHPVATSCRGLALNQPMAEAALRRAEIEMGSPPQAFHTGYRLGKHLSQQIIDRYGSQHFCTLSWHRFGPAGQTWRGILLPDPSN